MSIVKRKNNDTNNIQLFKNHFDNLLDDFFPSPFWGFSDSSGPLQTFAKPKINISEDEKSYHIEAELPGISKENIDIKYSDEILVISAERHDEKEDKSKNYHRTESFYGSLRRSISLPNVDKDKISAELKDGILTITLAKAKQSASEVKKIEIK